jgi:hypothetical protein
MQEAEPKASKRKKRKRKQRTDIRALFFDSFFPFTRPIVSDLVLPDMGTRPGLRGFDSLSVLCFLLRFLLLLAFGSASCIERKKRIKKQCTNAIGTNMQSASVRKSKPGKALTQN